ncbi:MAG: hypothetical protein Q4B65_02620 [Candidatus Saccharibacteria bacterium]|nr:hypothetical protein [Candidatus Saccharibacteria bacterium]
MSKFDEKVVEKFGEELTKSSEIQIKGLTAEDLKNWAYSYNVDIYSDPRSMEFFLKIVLNAPPHVGVIAQILRAVFLQEKGHAVQIVLADLEARSARGKKKTAISVYEKKYRAFIRALGFDDSKCANCLSLQSKNKYTMEKVFSLAPYIFDEDIDGLIPEYSHFNGGTNFGKRLMATATISNYFYPRWSGGRAWYADDRIVLSGLDEHAGISAAKKVFKRFIDSEGYLPYTVGGLYTPTIDGLNGHSKMNKTQRGSVIDVDWSLEDIQDFFRNYVDPENHEDSIIYQMMQAIMVGEGEYLAEARYEFYRDRRRWVERRRDFSEKLSQIFELWGE